MESVAGLDVGVKHSSLCVVRRDDRSMKPVSRHRTVTTPTAIGECWRCRVLAGLAWRPAPNRRGWRVSLSGGAWK
jgi:hypothetical protein